MNHRDMTHDFYNQLSMKIQFCYAWAWTLAKQIFFFATAKIIHKSVANYESAVYVTKLEIASRGLITTSGVVKSF